MEQPVKTRRMIYLIILALGLAVALAGGLIFHSETVVWIGSAIILGGIVYHFACYRCPHCGRYLFRNYGEYCQHCGKPLE